VKLRALFDNTDNALFPQQFVNARLLLKTLPNVVVAPQAAVQHGAPGDFVYVVEPGGTVHLQVVKLGVTQGGTVQILEGLKPGDTVVTDGLDRLRDGAKVSVTPPAGAAPPGATPGAPPGATAGGRRGARSGAAPADGAGTSGG
jgi:multidrug efflux system membrane fusion protein